MMLRSLLFCLFALSLSVFAQAQDDLRFRDIEQQLQQQAAARAGSRLYLHLDKTIYDPSEHIWFCAYLLQPLAPLAEYHTLQVSLSSLTTGKIVAEDRFVLDNGLAPGCLFLPDSLPAGAYELLAYTNRFGEEPARPFFRQEVQLRGAPPAFSARFRSQRAAGKDTLYLFEVKDSRGGYAGGLPLHYTLRADGEPVQSGKATVDANGLLPIAVNPASIRHKKTELLLSGSVEKDSIHQRLIFLPQPAEVRLRWYPEGGSLISGQPSRVAVEAFRSDGQPVAARFHLWEEERLLAELLTGRDGIGILSFTALAGRSYELRPADSDSLTVVADSFPEILPSGISMQVEQAFVSDSLRLRITGSQPRFSSSLLIHDGQKTIFYSEYKARTGRIRVSIPGTDLQAGLLTATLFDSVGLPVAERRIYVAPNEMRVQLTTDSASYGQRSPVLLRIKVTDSSGQPVQALFSLAAVQQQRVDELRFRNITEVAYLDPQNRFTLSGRQAPAARDSAAIEHWLLTHGWTRYRWSEKPTTQPLPLSSAGRVSGQVYYKGRKASGQLRLTVLGGLSLHPLQTRRDGSFELPPEALTADADVRLLISVMESGAGEYSIVFDHNEEPARRLLTSFSAQEPATPGPFAVAVPLFDPALARTLQNVVITGKARDNSTDFHRSYHRPDCNDYVCKYNILNCNNHPNGSRPVEGRSYSWQNRYGTMEVVVYKGCGSTGTKPASQGSGVVAFKGRYLTKEFYIADYAVHNPADPERYTTLFWGQRLLTDSKGEATLRFFTNDLPGRILCILQGLTDKEVFSGRHLFDVRR